MEKTMDKTLVTVDKINEIAVSLSFERDPELNDELKDAFGKDIRWNAGMNRWELRVDYLWAEKLVDAAVRLGFELTEEAQFALSELIDKRVDGRVGFAASRNAYLLDYKYDEGVKDAVKDLGARFDGDARAWYLPATTANTERLKAWLEKGEYSWVLTPTARERMAAAEKEYAEAVERSKSAASEFRVEGLGGELRPFQRAGVEYAVKTKRVMLGDEMGLGKTVQALAAVQHENAYPAVVVCPASLKLNWQRETEKWLPGRTVSVLGVRKSLERENADVTILNYEIVKKNADRLTKLGMKALVLDESHYVKNYKAQRTEAVKDLAKNVPMRLCLTGTPVLNRPQELLSQLGVLGRLDDLGGFWHFAKRYCGAYQSKFGWDFSGAANLKELNERMRSVCYVRREKAEVLKELPPKQRCVMPVELSNRSEYGRVEKDLVGYLMDRAEKDEKFLKSVEKMTPAERYEATKAYKRRKADSAERAEALVRLETLKLTAARGKVKAACDWISSFRETGQKLVVFAHHREVVDALKAEFPGALTITGTDSPERRAAAVDEFQNGGADVVICSIRAASTGLTLTAASNVLFIEQDWTPGVHDQAEDRCHRIGQEDSVTAWYLLGAGTIDEDVHALIEEKRSITSQANAGADYESGEVAGGVQKELLERMLMRAGVPKGRAAEMLNVRVPDAEDEIEREREGERDPFER